MLFGQVILKWVETIRTLKRYNKQKDELKTGEALIHVDFSESYNNTQQDEIQMKQRKTI